MLPQLSKFGHSTSTSITSVSPVLVPYKKSMAIQDSLPMATCDIKEIAGMDMTKSLRYRLPPRGPEKPRALPAPPKGNGGAAARARKLLLAAAIKRQRDQRIIQNLENLSLSDASSVEKRRPFSPNLRPSASLTARHQSKLQEHEQKQQKQQPISLLQKTKLLSQKGGGFESRLRFRKRLNNMLNHYSWDEMPFDFFVDVHVNDNLEMKSQRSLALAQPPHSKKQHEEMERTISPPKKSPSFMEKDFSVAA